MIRGDCEFSFERLQIPFHFGDRVDRYSEMERIFLICHNGAFHHIYLTELINYHKIYPAKWTNIDHLGRKITTGHFNALPKKHNKTSTTTSVTSKILPNVYKSCPIMISLENKRFWHHYKNCLRTWEIWTNLLLPKVLKSRPKSNKSSNVVTLTTTQSWITHIDLHIIGKQCSSFTLLWSLIQGGPTSFNYLTVILRRIICNINS